MKQMTSENYVKNAMHTDCLYDEECIKRITDKARILHAAMGMVTEAAEMLDMLKKHFFYAKPFDIVNAKEECGDQEWYIALAIDEMRSTMNDVLTTNIAKLKLRYPNKFNGEDAINRDVEAERVLLEKGEQSLVPDYIKEHFKTERENREKELDKILLETPVVKHNFAEQYGAISDFKLMIESNPSPNNWIKDRFETDKQHNNFVKIEQLPLTASFNKISERGHDWLSFAGKVLDHIENYTVQQYGDKGQDQVTNWSLQERLNQITKYAFRQGKNAREGQDELDLIKIAHYAQLSHNKLKGDV